jgi:SAM-dependent methyltransferase
MSAPMWSELEPVPRRRDWLELREAFAGEARETMRRWITSDQSHFGDQLAYALGRFDEGASLVAFFRKVRPRSGDPNGVDFLDVGSGNGGVAAGLANCRDFRVHTVDLVPNPTLARIRERLRIPVRSAVGSGHDLPFPADSFDVVLLLDMLEHVADPGRLACEVMRVLRPGGVCMLTTPARLKYLFEPDPHFGIRGLLFFPNEVQRLIVNRIFRRQIGSPDGDVGPAYDVEQIFWTVRSIARLFPEPKRVEPLFNRTLDPSRRFRGGWWYYRFRDLLWDRILISKDPRPDAPARTEIALRRGYNPGP